MNTSFVVIVNDSGVLSLASKFVFTTREDALRFASAIDQSTNPQVVGGDFLNLRQPVLKPSMPSFPKLPAQRSTTPPSVPGARSRTTATLTHHPTLASFTAPPRVSMPSSETIYSIVNR